jgi:hypothetical protein
VIVAILKFVTEVISPKTDRTSGFYGAEIAFKGDSQTLRACPETAVESR